MADRPTYLDDQRLFQYVDRTLKVLVGRLEREEDMHPDNVRKIAEAIDWLCATYVQRENAKTLTEGGKYE